MKILAIETSCDETAAAVIEDGRILSSVIASQAKLHAKFGGVVPEVAAREHVPVIMPTIDLALKQAQIKLIDLDTIAVTKGPGLATSLSVGIDAAKGLALALDIPLLPVNHMEAHVYANMVDEIPVFPALILIVSGGHTMIVQMTGHGKYKLIGETVDDAAGEAFDKTAKLLGLGYPGGPLISKLAEDGDPEAFDFPRPMLANPGFDFSFSGLKTAVLYETQKHKKIDKKMTKDFAASVQAAIIETLIGKFWQAAVKFPSKTLMLGGGVAANKKLREETIRLSDKLGVACSIPASVYCTDNAAMIGLAAYYRIKSKKAKYAENFRAEPDLSLV